MPHIISYHTHFFVSFRSSWLLVLVAACCNETKRNETKTQPSLLPGDPDAEFASYEAGDDSDVDVDEPLEMDCKGNVVNGNYGKVRVRARVRV